ncbi:MAG: hypothetical protein U0835_16600 [Isosphaeraceae bacterium]
MRLATALALPAYAAAVVAYGAYFLKTSTAPDPGLGLAILGLAWLMISCVPLVALCGGEPRGSLRFISYLAYWPLALFMAMMTGAEASNAYRYLTGLSASAGDPVGEFIGLSMLGTPVALLVFHFLVRRADVLTKCRRMNALVYWALILGLAVMLGNWLLIRGHLSGSSRGALETAGISRPFCLLFLGPALLFRCVEVFRGLPSGGGSVRIRLGKFVVWIPAPELVAPPLLGLAWLVLWWAGKTNL